MNVDNIVQCTLHCPFHLCFFYFPFYQCTSPHTYSYSYSTHSKWQAIQAQFVTALGALLGTVVGLTAGHSHDALESFLLAFTAGGFVYIATVTILPQVLQGGEKEEGDGCTGKAERPDTDTDAGGETEVQAHRERGLQQTVLECVGFCLGVGTMVGVALLEQ